MFSLQDVTVSGCAAEDGYADGEIYVQTLNAGSETIKSYTWIDIVADPDDPKSVAFYGWYDDETGELTDLTVASGE